MPPKRTQRDDTDEWVSRSQRKRESTALQRLAEELARLAPSEWERLPLTEDLLSALRDLRRIRDHEGRRRQMQYLGRLMREADGAAIEAAFADLKAR